MPPAPIDSGFQPHKYLETNHGFGEYTLRIENFEPMSLDEMQNYAHEQATRLCDRPFYRKRGLRSDTMRSSSGKRKLVIIADIECFLEEELEN